MRVSFIRVNGIETRYYEAGEGPVLLLVHGAGVSADGWIPLMKRLSRTFRVIAPDTLGHGFTGRGDYNGGPPQPAMVNHLLALLDTLGEEKVILGGSSYGAMLAMLAYFQVKDRISRLIFFSSASTTLTDEERARSLKMAYANGTSAIGNPTLDSVRARMARLFHDPAKLPEELVLMQLTIYSRPEVQESYELIMRGMMDLEAAKPWRVNTRFAEIEVPLLMLWGLDDKRVRYERALESAAAAREAYLVGIRDCSHEPHIEHPDEVAGLIAQFYDGTLAAEHLVKGASPHGA